MQRRRVKPRSTYLERRQKNPYFGLLRDNFDLRRDEMDPFPRGFLMVFL